VVHGLDRATTVIGGSLFRVYNSSQRGDNITLPKHDNIGFGVHRAVTMKSNAMYASRSSPTFRKVVFPSSVSKSKLKKKPARSRLKAVPSKRRWTSAEIYVVTAYSFGYEFES
jgi:hypothetical protein